MTERFPDDDLQALWADQPTHGPFPDTKELTMNVRKQHHKEQRRLLYLNLREAVPAAAMAGIFGLRGIQATSRGWAYFAAALLCFGVGAFLVATSIRQRQREQLLDDTTLGELERARFQAQHRMWLYRNIGWWYLLPIACGVLLLLIAQNRDFASPDIIIYLCGGAAFGAAIFWFNRKVARDTYEPQVERLSRLISDMS